MALHRGMQSNMPLHLCNGAAAVKKMWKEKSGGKVVVLGVVHLEWC